MKHLLLTTIAAVVLVGCGTTQQVTVQAPDISIHDAAAKGNIEAFKQHLATGTDVDVKGGWLGGTPLHYAARDSHKEIAELLLANGARLIGFEAYELGSIWGDEPKRSISPAQE